MCGAGGRPVTAPTVFTRRYVQRGGGGARRPARWWRRPAPARGGRAEAGRMVAACVCICVCVYVCMCVRVRVCVSVYLCVFIRAAGGRAVRGSPPPDGPAPHHRRHHVLLLIFSAAEAAAECGVRLGGAARPRPPTVGVGGPRAARHRHHWNVPNTHTKNSR